MSISSWFKKHLNKKKAPSQGAPVIKPSEAKAGAKGTVVTKISLPTESVSAGLKSSGSSKSSGGSSKALAQLPSESVSTGLKTSKPGSSTITTQQAAAVQRGAPQQFQGAPVIKPSEAATGLRGTVVKDISLPRENIKRGLETSTPGKTLIKKEPAPKTLVKEFEDRGILTTSLRYLGMGVEYSERARIQTMPTTLESVMPSQYKEAKAKASGIGVQILPFALTSVLAPPVGAGLLATKAYEDIFTPGGKRERIERAEFVSKYTGLSNKQTGILTSPAMAVASIPETLELAGGLGGLAPKIIRFQDVTTVKFVGFKAQVDKNRIQTDVVFKTSKGESGVATGRTAVLQKDNIILSKTAVIGKKGIKDFVSFAGKEESITQIIQGKDVTFLKQIGAGRVGLLDGSLTKFSSAEIGALKGTITISKGVTKVPELSSKVLSTGFVKEVSLPSDITFISSGSGAGSTTGGTATIIPQLTSQSSIATSISQLSTESIVRAAILAPTKIISSSLPSLTSVSVVATQQKIDQPQIAGQTQPVIQPTAQEQLLIPKLSTPQKTETITIPRIKTGSSTKTITETIQSTKLITPTIQVPIQQQVYSVPSKTIAPPTTPTVPKIPLFAFKLPKILQPKQQTGKFPVYLRRFNSWKIIGYGTSPLKAVGIGKRAAQYTLAASFKVPGIKPTKIPGFYTKKEKGELIFIEPKKRRIKKGTKELPELMYWKGLKSKTNKKRKRK